MNTQECCERCKDIETEYGSTTCNFKHPENGAIGICECHTWKNGFEAGRSHALQEVVEMIENMKIDTRFSGHWKNGFCNALSDLLSELEINSKYKL